jgi:hypothetical protein
MILELSDRNPSSDVTVSCVGNESPIAARKAIWATTPFDLLNLDDAQLSCNFTEFAFDPVLPSSYFFRAHDLGLPKRITQLVSADV